MSKSISKWLIPLIVLLVAIVLLVPYVIGSSNSMTRSMNDVEEQLGNVSTQLQRRADLIPNLVNSVQADQNQEREIMDSITSARAGVDKASTPQEKVEALQKEQAAINSGINVIVENYPNLQSSQRVQELMVQLEGTENRISVERTKFNEVAKKYNNLVTVFPRNIIASFTGHNKISYFENAPGTDAAPEVAFNN